jgi:nucleoside-diphosphate-sugar epimerase
MTTTNQASLDASRTNPTVGQKSLVVVGASGMVGGYALRYALDNSDVKNVTSIGRKKLGISHAKLKEVLHQNFADCSPLADALSNQDAVVYCLGTYTGSVSDAELHRITVDYTVEFSRVLRGSSPGAAFSFLSGNGADPTGRSRLAFARYKGEAENAVLAAGSRMFTFSGLRTSTPSSRGTNRTSATGCCARFILYSGCCSRTRSFAPMIWPAPWWILCCDRHTSAKA